jgi:hypothetical protein
MLRRVGAATVVFCLISLGLSSCSVTRRIHRGAGKNPAQPLAVTDKATLIAALEKRLFQSKLKEKQEAALRDYLDSRGALDQDGILGAIRLLMSTPEYQLT